MVRIFVGGLPPSITAGEVTARFTPFGEVSGCELIPAKDGGDGKNTKDCRGFGYIDFTPKDDASLVKCFSLYNNCKWKGHVLRVEVAKEHYLKRLQVLWEKDKEQPKQSSSEQSSQAHGQPIMGCAELNLAHPRMRDKILTVTVGQPNHIRRHFPPSRVLPTSQLPVEPLKADSILYTAWEAFGKAAEWEEQRKQRAAAQQQEKPEESAPVVSRKRGRKIVEFDDDGEAAAYLKRMQLLQQAAPDGNDLSRFDDSDSDAGPLQAKQTRSLNASASAVGPVAHRHVMASQLQSASQATSSKPGAAHGGSNSSAAAAHVGPRQPGPSGKGGDVPKSRAAAAAVAATANGPKGASAALRTETQVGGLQDVDVEEGGADGSDHASGDGMDESSSEDGLAAESSEESLDGRYQTDVNGEHGRDDGAQQGTWSDSADQDESSYDASDEEPVEGEMNQEGVQEISSDVPESDLDGLGEDVEDVEDAEASSGSDNNADHEESSDEDNAGEFSEDDASRGAEGRGREDSEGIESGAGVTDVAAVGQGGRHTLQQVRAGTMDGSTGTRRNPHVTPPPATPESQTRFVEKVVDFGSVDQRQQTAAALDLSRFGSDSEEVLRDISSDEEVAGHISAERGPSSSHLNRLPASRHQSFGKKNGAKRSGDDSRPGPQSRPQAAASAAEMPGAKRSRLAVGKSAGQQPDADADAQGQGLVTTAAEPPSRRGGARLERPALDTIGKVQAASGGLLPRRTGPPQPTAALAADKTQPTQHAGPPQVTAATAAVKCPPTTASVASARAMDATTSAASVPLPVALGLQGARAADDHAVDQQARRRPACAELPAAGTAAATLRQQLGNQAPAAKPLALGAGALFVRNVDVKELNAAWPAQRVALVASLKRKRRDAVRAAPKRGRTARPA